jgi:hypothetical protein
MLRPFLLVGIGGSGGKTLRALRVALERRLLEIPEWDGGWPDAWQMLHLDTPVAQDGPEFPAPFLDGDLYQGMVPQNVPYEALVAGMVGQPHQSIKLDRDDMNKFAGWIPNPASVVVPVSQGAGQFRSIGKTLTVARLESVQASIKNSLIKIGGGGGELSRLAQLLGAKSTDIDEPAVIVVSSIAGGSGAGAFMDVIEAIKSADSSKAWLQKVVAWLYTPEVFASVKGNDGTAPNALGAISEAMAGLWIGEASPETVALYKGMKITPSSGSAYTLGARYTFLIGRSNSGGVDFGGQSEVYSAIASSLSAMITDDAAQTEFFNYYLNNIDSTGASATTLPDMTNLFDRSINASGNNRPPFLSGGFARLSLGRDRFREYASERLARDVVERLLFQHLRTLPPTDTRPDAEKLEDAVKNAWVQFLGNSGLNERNPANDIIDALRPADRKARASQFKQDALAKAGGGVGSDGLDAAGWQTRFLAFWTAEKGAFLVKEQAARYEAAREWVVKISESFPAHVSRSIAQWGLPVVVRLLEELDREMEFFTSELKSEIAEKERILASLQGSIHQALTKSGQAKMPLAHPDVEAAASSLAGAIDLFASEIELRQAANVIIDDLRRNLLRPLREATSNGWQALQSRVKAKELADGRENPFFTWPDPITGGLPGRFAPPPNERLLVDVKEFPNEFMELVTNTLPTNLRQGPANDMDKIAAMAMLGDLAITDGSPKVGFNLLEKDASWIPTDHLLQSGTLTGAASSARFAMSDDVEVYLDHARKWLSRDGSAFGNYLKISLGEYLGDNGAPQGELTQRRQAFSENMSEILKRSAPLIQINASILASIHPGVGQNDNRLIFSTVPFEPDSTMADRFKASLSAYGIKDSKLDAAMKSLGQTRAQNIDIFTFQDNPLEPMVYDSIMRPIANGWAGASGNISQRTAFWKYRRARALREFIPADPQRISEMVQGWFVATAMGYYKATKSETLGPKIEVWSQRYDWVSFPYPLLYPGNAPEKEYLGSVLESLSIAIANCNISPSDPLGPLAPYHRLMELGNTAESSALISWVKDGVLPDGAPEPAADRAGTRSGGAVERKNALVAFFDKQLANYAGLFAEYEKNGNPYVAQRNWEISSYIINGLNILKQSVDQIELESFN